MNMSLSRTDFLSNGIFGFLESEDESLSLFTLEHAYGQGPDGVQSESQIFTPKIPSGEFRCVRGIHKLEDAHSAFETFMIEVPGHTNILFHPGNANDDSSGCVLLGLARNENKILHSRDAFEKFMDLQKGCLEFTLTVA